MLRTLIVCFLNLVIVGGCSGTVAERLASGGPDGAGFDSGVGADALVTGDDGGAGVAGYPEFARQFGTISTVAGTALIEDKGVNGWEAQMEGGPADEAELSRPHITLADSDGNLYIADKDADAVRKVDTNGVITTIAGPEALRAPNGLFLVEDVIYVLDLGNDRVAKIEGGAIATLFEIGGAGNGRGLWVNDDETLAYVAAGTSLKRWTPAEGVTTLASGFVSLANLHVGPDGTLGVTDRGAHLVYRVDTITGEKRVIAGNGTTSGGGDGELATETGLNEVRGIWFEPRGGMLLCTHKGGDVWYVDAGGYIHLMVAGDASDAHAGDGQPFDAPGDKISEPRAVTMSPSGDLIITEHDGGFIRVVSRR